MISVIIPVKNSEKTVKQAIESVLNQGVEEVEIICIVNGCDDESENVIKKIKDSRITVIESSPGIVPALNAGIRKSKGNLIARQDADDVWHEGKLQAQVKYLEENNDIDILGTQLQVVDKFENHIENTKYPLSHEDIVTSLLNGINPIGHPSVIFRRKVLDKCSGYLDLFPLAEDLDLWIRAACWYKFANLEETYVTYKHVPNPRYDPRIPKTLAAWYRMIYGVK